jgi:hypothetical protein
VLHELGHCALHLHDAENSPDEIGECESYINHISRELGLPERQHYGAYMHQMMINAGNTSIMRAELTFARPVNKPGKTKPALISLSWEAGKVGESGAFKAASAPKDRAASVAGQQ